MFSVFFSQLAAICSSLQYTKWWRQRNKAPSVYACYIKNIEITNICCVNKMLLQYHTDSRAALHNRLHTILGTVIHRRLVLKVWYRRIKTVKHRKKTKKNCLTKQKKTEGESQRIVPWPRRLDSIDTKKRNHNNLTSLISKINYINDNYHDDSKPKKTIKM
jgi:hypothetical protein